MIHKVFIVYNLHGKSVSYVFGTLIGEEQAQKFGDGICLLENIFKNGGPWSLSTGRVVYPLRVLVCRLLEGALCKQTSARKSDGLNYSSQIPPYKLHVMMMVWQLITPESLPTVRETVVLSLQKHIMFLNQGLQQTVKMKQEDNKKVKTYKYSPNVAT